MIAARGQQDPDTLKLTKPVLRWENDAFLALHEANRMRATGDNRIRPIEEVADVNHEWEWDVITELDHLQWLEDYYHNLSPDVRAILERTRNE